MISSAGIHIKSTMDMLCPGNNIMWKSPTKRRQSWLVQKCHRRDPALQYLYLGSNNMWDYFHYFKKRSSRVVGYDKRKRLYWYLICLWLRIQQCHCQKNVMEVRKNTNDRYRKASNHFQRILPFPRTLNLVILNY